MSRAFWVLRTVVRARLSPFCERREKGGIGTGVGFPAPHFGVTGARFCDTLRNMPKRAARAGNPKAMAAVARQRLLLINGLLDEVSRNYVARLHRELVDLARALESAAREGICREKDMRAILKRIEHLQIDPERGRRKDLKKIDTLIGAIQAVVEGW